MGMRDIITGYRAKREREAAFQRILEEKREQQRRQAYAKAYEKEIRKAAAIEAIKGYQNKQATLSIFKSGGKVKEAAGKDWSKDKLTEPKRLRWFK